MYSREKVELFLLATEDGMGPTAAAEFAGVTVSAAKKWATGHLPGLATPIWTIPGGTAPLP